MAPKLDHFVVERLIRLVGGHPYLVRQAFHALGSCETSSIGYLEQAAPDDRGTFGDHLRRHIWALRDNERLRKSLRQTIGGRGCGDEDDFQRLRAAGLIDGASPKEAKMRCELYTRYMREHL